jgi:hypothetical protein
MAFRGTLLASSPLQPYAAPTPVARGSFGDQFDPGGGKRIDKLHQRIHVPRTTPPLDSIRWIVGSESPERWASSR